MRVIDLNADLGEGFGRWTLGDDEALLHEITSANVACGFHAGDASIMRAVCDLAVEQGVRIGAQVGYRDLAGFGRREIAYDPEELADEVLYQIGALDGFARAAGDRVRYVKPHGALYNRVVWDESQAAAVVDGARRYDADMPVLGLAGSAVLTAARNVGLPTVYEAFADRAYTAEGSLVPRSAPGALIHDADEVEARIVKLATTGAVEAIDGDLVHVEAESICLHGDTPGAVELVRRVKSALVSAGVQVEPFA